MRNEVTVNGVKERELLGRISEAYQRILDGKLTGIYVHGSIAFGCFRWETSDIDFVVVVEEKLTQAEKEALIRVLLELDVLAPAKGFEMSVVLRSSCAPFEEPTPFELHYSNAHRANYQYDLSGTCSALQGFDPDLAAHMTVVGKVGIVLCGQPVEQVFGPVPRESYLRSIWYDIENAPEEIQRDPVYYVLNLCRVLACVEDKLVLSKKQGGEWGMEHLPEEQELIRKALAAYLCNAPAPSGTSLCSFAEKVLGRIRQSDVFLNACLKKD